MVVAGSQNSQLRIAFENLTFTRCSKLQQLGSSLSTLPTAFRSWSSSLNGLGNAFLMAETPMSVSVVVEIADTKHVKTHLEASGKLNKSKKITRISNPFDSRGKDVSAIPTTWTKEDAELQILDLFSNNIGGGIYILPEELDPWRGTENTKAIYKSKLHQAVSEWAKSLEMSERAIPMSSLLDALPCSFTVYDPMLLLPHNAFESKVWIEFLGSLSTSHCETLFQAMAESTHCTHVAVTGPIPPTIHAQVENSSKIGDISNKMRSPTNLSPLFGDFGSFLGSIPFDVKDMESAFWVKTKQNGIHQTWAPRYTMFSRGNIKEKARILNLIENSDLSTREPTIPWTAVDLYAGIGYFAFSYLKAGAQTVLCWDINGWSIEGLRRGAQMNGWSSTIFSSGSSAYKLLKRVATQRQRILAFNGDNRLASDMIQGARSLFPPIRHVNCGLLPSSEGSWQSAVNMVDPFKGGWIHLHENFKTEEIDQKAKEVCIKIQQILDRIEQNQFKGSVRLEHVEQVKSYAPGVKHCVLDIYIPARLPMPG